MIALQKDTYALPFMNGNSLNPAIIFPRYYFYIQKLLLFLAFSTAKVNLRLALWDL